jgi:hypothetical protein
MMYVGKLDIPSDKKKLLQKMNLEAGGRVQQVIDAAVIRYCIPYVPFENGDLAGSPYRETTIGSGEIKYPGPYAHYMYYGEVYGPNFPIFVNGSAEPIWRSKKGEAKHPMGRKLTYRTEKNALAGPFWFERMKADHLNDIIEEAGKAVGA